MNTPEKTDNDQTWKTTIRTDLWSRMNVDQLVIQQDIIIKQINLLYTMELSRPEIRTLMEKLQQANDDIAIAIEFRTNHRITGLV